jgi:hypothetical protein
MSLGFYRGCYSLSHGSHFGADVGHDVQGRLVMIVGSFSAEVHEQVDGVGHSRRVFSRLEDGLVFGMFLAARFLGRHVCGCRVVDAREAVRKVLASISWCSAGVARRPVSVCALFQLNN